MHNALKSLINSATNYFSPNKSISSKPEALYSDTGMAPRSTGSGGSLFSDVVYYDSATTLTEKHRKLLEKGGAVEMTLDRDVGWENVTHVFTLDLEFPGKQDALNGNIKNKEIAIVTVLLLDLTADL